MDEKLWLQKGDGSAYEAYVAGAIATSNPGLAVQRDVRMPGRKSERMRQIDILLGEPGQVAVECKYFHRKVDVKAVEAFLGMMDDVGIRKGLIVTSRGFTAAAAKRAANDDRHLNLHTIAPDRLSDYQFVGTPLLYRGSIAISLDCPKHWVVDTEHPDALMMMYPLGFSLAAAIDAGPIIYANLLDPGPRGTMESLAHEHEATLLKDDAAHRIARERSNLADLHQVVRACLKRRAISSVEGRHEEHALYVDYGDLILLLVLQTPPVHADELMVQLMDLYRTSFRLTVSFEQPLAQPNQTI